MKTIEYSYNPEKGIWYNSQNLPVRLHKGHYRTKEGVKLICILDTLHVGGGHGNPKEIIRCPRLYRLSDLAPVENPATIYQVLDND